MTGQRSDASSATINPCLPPHLREVCAILAAGLLRLRRRTTEELARDVAQAAAGGEISLHFTARQSVCADSLERVSP